VKRHEIFSKCHGCNLPTKKDLKEPSAFGKGRFDYDETRLTLHWGLKHLRWADVWPQPHYAMRAVIPWPAWWLVQRWPSKGFQNYLLNESCVYWLESTNFVSLCIATNFCKQTTPCDRTSSLFPWLCTWPYFIGGPGVQYGISRVCHTLLLYPLPTLDQPYGHPGIDCPHNKFSILVFGPPLDPPWNTALVVRARPLRQIRFGKIIFAWLKCPRQHLTTPPLPPPLPSSSPDATCPFTLPSPASILHAFFYHHFRQVLRHLFEF
jgi:hypothetical protein